MTHSPQDPKTVEELAKESHFEWSKKIHTLLGIPEEELKRIAVDCYIPAYKAGYTSRDEEVKTLWKRNLDFQLRYSEMLDINKKLIEALEEDVEQYGSAAAIHTLKWLKESITAKPIKNKDGV